MFPPRVHSRRKSRRGTTLVESAFVLPVFLLLVLSMLEFSRALMVKNVLRGACRTAARMASTGGQSVDDVENHVRQLIGSTVDPGAVLVFVKDASVYDTSGAVSQTGQQLESLPNIDFTTAPSRQLFMVRARVNYGDVALVPMPFAENIVLEGQAFTRLE
jgi:Flp pilus assembly protein TadG